MKINLLFIPPQYFLDFAVVVYLTNQSSHQHNNITICGDMVYKILVLCSLIISLEQLNFVRTLIKNLPIWQLYHRNISLHIKGRKFL